MSYILDALKKLESEKSKKTRSDGMVNIAGALLRDEPRRNSSGIAWKVAAVVVAASLVTFAVTWFVLHADKGKRRSRPTAVVQTPPVAPVAPPVVAPPVTPVQPPSAAVPSPAPPATAAKQPAPHVPSPKPQAAVPSAPAVKDDVSVSKQVERQKKQKRQNVRPADGGQPVAPIFSAPPADIKVSGIAWQDERNARRAIVNGFLLHEGSVVSGARITEILKDRVRFSSGDNAFEAPLLMSVVPAAGK